MRARQIKRQTTKARARTGRLWAAKGKEKKREEQEDGKRRQEGTEGEREGPEEKLITEEWKKIGRGRLLAKDNGKREREGRTREGRMQWEEGVEYTR